MKRQTETEQGQKNWSSIGHLPTTGTSRTSAVYWKKRLERTVSSTDVTNSIYSVRIYFQKRRKRFSLHSSNKNEASNLAAKIYSSLVGQGWEKTLDQFNIEDQAEVIETKPNTVGALIQAACKHSTARDQSKNEYSKALRRIVSALMGFDTDKRFASRNHSGNEQWRSAVDEVLLS